MSDCLAAGHEQTIREERESAMRARQALLVVAEQRDRLQQRVRGWVEDWEHGEVTAESALQSIRAVLDQERELAGTLAP